MKGSAIRERLVSSGYDLEEVANKMGLARNQLDNLFSSENISYNVLTEISKATGKDVIIFEDNYTQNNSASGGKENTVDARSSKFGATNVLGDLYENGSIVRDLIELLKVKDKEIERLLGLLEKANKN